MNFVILSNTSFYDKSYAKSTVQIATELSNKGHKVLYIDYPGTVKDWYRNNSDFDKLRRVNHFLWTWKPKPIIPSNWAPNSTIHNFISKLNSKIISGDLAKIRGMIGMDEYELIIALNPQIGRYWFDHKVNKKIYYCYDDITEAEWLKKHGGRCEKDLLKQVDYVFCSSPKLMEIKSSPNRLAKPLFNGADHNMFSKAWTDEETNIVGFMGSLDHRVDFDFLKEVISLTPNTKWQFIGRVVDNEGVKKISGFDNVEFLGPKFIEDLPNYMKHFNVGIIPFKLDKFNQSIFPLKIIEYFAAGIPVIATPFAHFMKLNEFTKIEKDPQEWSNYVQQSHKRSTSLQKLAENYTWENSVKKFINLIQ